MGDKAKMKLKVKGSPDQVVKAVKKLAGLDGLKKKAEALK